MLAQISNTTQISNTFRHIAMKSQTFVLLKLCLLCRQHAGKCSHTFKHSSDY